MKPFRLIEFDLLAQERVRGAPVGDVKVVAGSSQYHKQRTSLALQLLRAGGRVVGDYDDLPVDQIAASPGAAKASLHKARRRVREHITTHCPDLIPVLSRRTPMTAVRIARTHPHLGTRPDGGTAIGHILVVLADEPGHRAMELWLRTRQGLALWQVLDRTASDTGLYRPPHALPGGD